MKFQLGAIFASALLALWAGPVRSQDKPDGPTILDNPFDFSSEPKLPIVEPAGSETIRRAIDRGVRFLIEDQNKNGSWGSATRTKGLNIYAPVPGAHHAFRAATTSLCIAA